MSDSRPAAGRLVRMTRNLQVAAIVQLGFAIFCYVAAFTSASSRSFERFMGLFYLTAIGAIVFGVGGVVGRLLIAARRDEEEGTGAAPPESSQNWYQ
jgi:hypothetical protein